MRDVSILIAATFALVSGMSATAQTPDGETPAVETVCDPLTDATPGLYGLCVAFCEAHDADLLSELDVPNRNILRNYNTKKTEFDPPMPCLQQVVDECPCWTADELSTVLRPTMNYDANLQNSCRNDMSVALENVENVDSVTGEPVPPLIQLSARNEPYEWNCEVVNMDYNGGPPSSDISLETKEEFLSCIALLVARANDAMIPGTVWDCF